MICSALTPNSSSPPKRTETCRPHYLPRRYFLPDPTCQGDAYYFLPDPTCQGDAYYFLAKMPTTSCPTLHAKAMPTTSLPRCLLLLARPYMPGCAGGRNYAEGPNQFHSSSASGCESVAGAPQTTMPRRPNDTASKSESKKT